MDKHSERAMEKPIFHPFLKGKTTLDFGTSNSFFDKSYQYWTWSELARKLRIVETLQIVISPADSRYF
jgi:hypothetical protein